MEVSPLRCQEPECGRLVASDPRRAVRLCRCEPCRAKHAKAKGLERWLRWAARQGA